VLPYEVLSLHNGGNPWTNEPNGKLLRVKMLETVRPAILITIKEGRSAV